ncbi:hypothetical protein J2S43_004288 [Catenuloplanes nepalensis]|uniref:Uncharacterized protein n=1 Tax=Catenuloplanes nepalensis TaxID=587533 RepID=A0ABT9MWG4_9ACTN|nr:hypothetical protein [Catenuloplanes nepalensis]MDP9795776.1 hypothetical protein [Catenuloplanes nepalensis]
MSSHSYINPESVFAQTALEMVAIHGPENGDSDDTMCDRCQQPLPCPPVRNAMPVLEAAGLPVYPPGSAEARRAAAESGLGRAVGPPSGATLPGVSKPAGATLPGLPEATLPGLPEGEPVEATVGAPAAEGAPTSPDGPPAWPDPASARAVA